MIPAALAPLVNHLWQSTIFAAVAGLLTLALRRNQARVRYWLWLAASYKFLFPFAWLASLGHVFQWRAAPAIMPHAFTSVRDAVSGPIFLTALPAAKPAPDHLAALLIAIWSVWACGFVAVTAGWAREWLRIRAIVRAASPLPFNLPNVTDHSEREQPLGCHSEERRVRALLGARQNKSDEESLLLSSFPCGEILRFAQNDSQRPFLQHPIQVVSTPARIEPGVFGIFRPVLLLPEGIATRLTPAQLQAVLVHELCHVRRRDNLTAAIQMLVEALFWFYPLVWWLGARMVDERERACDEEVLQAGSQAQVYAESILKVCEFYLESPLTCISGVTGSDLKKRMERIMNEHFGATLTTPKKFLLATAGMAALAVPLVAGVLTTPRLQAQSPSVPDWQTAGGKMGFEVASVKPHTSSVPAHGNVSLSEMDEVPPNGGLLSEVDFPLSTYIGFAYKLTPNQRQFLRPQLPRWATTDRFDIEARAEGNPTRDQMRLMMQSLLMDRFKLAVHAETRQLPMFGLVLDKPGKTGPQLQPHSDDPPCTTPPAPGSTPTTPTKLAVPGGFPSICGGILFPLPDIRASDRMQASARNLTMGQIATNLASMGLLDRPVLDQTGLSGNFDFILEWMPNRAPDFLPPDVILTPNPTVPTFLNALQEQLGLNLQSQTGPVNQLFIDHVEELSPN